MMNGAREYKRIDVTSRLEAADPHALVTMMFDGALARLKQADGCITHNDFAGKAKAIDVSVAIIAGLQGSLDLERGGELAANLDSLYDYMQRQLFRASVDNDSATVNEVRDLLETLKEAWLAIADEQNLVVGAAGANE